MSRAPKNPWGNFGPDDGSRRALRLVEAPDVTPAAPRWFSFRAAVMIAAGVLLAGAVWGAMVRVQAYVEAQFERREAPVIVVESVPAPETVHERVPREEVALPVPPPVVPKNVVDVARPEVLPEVVLEEVPEEPFEISEAWEEAAEPFPEATEHPSSPQPAKPISNSRPRPKVASKKPATSRSKPAAPRPQRVAARVKRRVQPVYPSSARRAGVEGRVVVQASVGANGRVSSVSLASSSGSRALDAAALSAVKRWSFSPETYGGKAVDSAVRVPILFQLR